MKRVIISDLHIGSKFYRSKELLKFLKSEYYDELILAGDIIDFIKIPVWERNVAMVYQQFINYNHLNVYENITFQLEQRKLSPEQIKKDVVIILKVA